MSVSSDWCSCLPSSSFSCLFSAFSCSLLAFNGKDMDWSSTFPRVSYETWSIADSSSKWACPVSSSSLRTLAWWVQSTGLTVSLGVNSLSLELELKSSTVQRITKVSASFELSALRMSYHTHSIPWKKDSFLRLMWAPMEASIFHTFQWLLWVRKGVKTHGIVQGFITLVASPRSGEFILWSSRTWRHTEQWVVASREDKWMHCQARGSGRYSLSFVVHLPQALQKINQII